MVLKLIKINEEYFFIKEKELTIYEDRYHIIEEYEYLRLSLNKKLCFKNQIEDINKRIKCIFFKKNFMLNRRYFRVN